jgi:hypothetical protein
VAAGGEWIAWLVQAQSPSVTMPLWLFITLAVVTALGPIIIGGLAVRATTKQTAATQRTASGTLALEKEKGHRELIVHADQLLHSGDRVTREQGLIRLFGIAQMPLSHDNLRLLVTITRGIVEPKLAQGRQLEQSLARRPKFWTRQTRPEPEEGR